MKYSLQKQASLKIGVVFLISAICLILFIDHILREHALNNARDKASIIINKYMAIHTYSTHQLKPHLFQYVDPNQFFDPVLMSSTYMVREVNTYFEEIQGDGYYFKECAINARNPLNEADDMEYEFISNLNKAGSVETFSGIKKIDGVEYYVLMKKGETIEQMCLACHSTPDRAPQELVEKYGADRSFEREIGEVVSALSIRVPVSKASHEANTVFLQLSSLSLLFFVLLFTVQYRIYSKQVMKPLLTLRDRTLLISEEPNLPHDNIKLPKGKEFAELTQAFNNMNQEIAKYQDNLENLVSERTNELSVANTDLKKALHEIKKLQGIIPICSYCKKIRSDEGIWNQLENYISSHSEAQFSHGVCPECYEKALEDFKNEKFL